MSPPLPPPIIRTGYSKLLKGFGLKAGKEDREVSTMNVDIPSRCGQHIIPCTAYFPGLLETQKSKLPVFLYAHGGGWTVGKGSTRTVGSRGRVVKVTDKEP
jgi:acetyl esterase/lipase